MPNGDVNVGDTISYTIEIENNGSVNANNINVTDLLPSGLNYVPGTASATYWESDLPTTGSFSYTMSPANQTFNSTGLTQSYTVTSADIPSNAILTSYTYNVTVSTTDWLSEISMVASYPQGSLTAGSFGGNVAGNNVSQTATVNVNGAISALGNYNFVWDDPNDFGTNTVNDATFTINYTIPTVNRSQVTNTVNDPANMIVSGDNVNLFPGETMTVTLNAIVNASAAGTTQTNTVNVGANYIGTVSDTASNNVLIPVDQCDASASGNLDTDGDNVSDICDLDNDNDGILDTDEGKCTSQVLSGAWTISGTTASYDFGNGVIAEVSTTNAIDFTAGNFTNDSFWTENLANDTSLQNQYIWGSTLTVNYVDALGNPVTVTNPIIHLDRLGGTDGVTTQNGAIVTLLNGLTWNELTGTSDFNVASSTASDTGINAPADPAHTQESTQNDADGTAAGTLQINGEISTFTLEFVQGGLFGTGTDGIEIILSTCQSTDTDNDNIPDYLDVDSDGDGCYDAIEGAGSFTTANLTSSNNLADDNEGQVDANGIPEDASTNSLQQATTSGVTDNTDLTACGGVTGTVDITDTSVPGDTLDVVVTDNDLNTDPLVAETIVVTVVNDVTGESEDITLTETGPNTGEFAGTVDTTFGTVAGTDNDGTINTQTGDTVTVTYDDVLDANGNDPVAVTDTDTVGDTDSDGDGVLNSIEIANGTNPIDECDYNVADITEVITATTDCDNDGLTDAEEITGVDDPSTPADPAGNTTDPTDPDTDGDGVTDGQEALDGTDPNNSCEYLESSITLPQDEVYLAADCDGDGVTNGQEEIDGTDALDPCDYLAGNQDITIVSEEWEALDCDGDGVINGTEILDSTDPQNPCDFIVASTTVAQSAEWLNGDCDNDNVPNGVEQSERDTDGDSIPDYLDTDDDGDGVDTINEDYGNTDFEDGDINPTGDNDPTNDDTDGDSIPDYLDTDDDNDGIPTEDEYPDPDNNGIGFGDDAVDSDGLPDYLDVNNASPEEDDLEIFNAVTPNGDGENDVFIIRNIELYPENTVKIYNRWGVIVYETSSYGSVGNYFNGRSNGRVTIQVEELLPVGTYFYVVEYVVEGETKSRAGYLYLQR